MVMDPLLGNPNSKYNILALTHHLKKVSDIDIETRNIEMPIDGLDRENSRQWCFVSADAAIALQVSNTNYITYQIN